MEPNKGKDAKESKAGTVEATKVSAGGWKTSERTVRRTFPGPRDARAALRVAVDRAAHAELIAHAKTSLDKEICGVLAGNICEDEQGPFVHVMAIIRGTAASHGNTHVTFTHETWNAIHKSLEQDYPKMQIVGWYHSHPGFGVEFSDMDLFIQKNFFSGSSQIALVTDPLSGAVAICINGVSGIEYLDRFWVDGREQACQVPKSQLAKGKAEGPVAGVDPEALRALESRVGQLIQLMDEQRASYQRFLMFVGATVCIGAVACFIYVYYSQFRYRNEPPQVNQVIPVPIQVGDKTVIMGVAITEWKVPEELNAVSIAVEKERLAAEAKAAKDATNSVKTNAPESTSETNSPKK